MFYENILATQFSPNPMYRSNPICFYNSPNVPQIPFTPNAFVPQQQFVQPMTANAYPTGSMTNGKHPSSIWHRFEEKIIIMNVFICRIRLCTRWNTAAIWHDGYNWARVWLYYVYEQLFGRFESDSYNNSTFFCFRLERFLPVMNQPQFLQARAPSPQLSQPIYCTYPQMNQQPFNQQLASSYFAEPRNVPQGKILMCLNKLNGMLLLFFFWSFQTHI